MIQINELRIGNRCTYGNHGHVIISELKQSGKVRVMHTQQRSIDMGYSSSLLKDDDIDPIILTSAILDMCGFKFRGMYSGQPWYTLQEVSITRYCQGYRLCEEDSYDGNLYLLGKPFSSFHQLQNLYAALTAEDIVIDKTLEYNC